MKIEKVEELLKRIWLTEVKEMMALGFLVYERQVQAEIYSRLKLAFGSINDFRVWMEPVIYLEDSTKKKVIPDLIITYKTEIISIIEIKFKPWESVHVEGDIIKLKQFEKYKGKSFQLGIIPISNNWANQKEKGSFLNYSIKDEFLQVFITFEEPKGNSFQIKEKYDVDGILHLYGSISDIGQLEFGVEKFEKDMM